MARSPSGSGRGPRDRDRGRDRKPDEESELTDKLVTINRVAKVVKGGRRFAFAAIVVVGDQRGRVGHGAGKAREVPEAIRKATEAAMRALFETLGVKDIVAKSVGTSNPHNMIKATFVALEQLNSPRMVATRRGKKVGDLLGRRDGDQAVEAAA